MLYQTPHKYECATDDVHLSAALLTLDVETGKAVGIERIFYPEFEKTPQGWKGGKDDGGETGEAEL
jgi:calcineurin-like phosphoesterase